MKKLKYLLVLLISIFVLTINVKAASGNLSVNKNNVYVGDSFTVTVKANSMAAWNIHVTATGPVSGCTINQADATADAMDTSKTFTATCKATGEGKITIKLSGDVTSASDGNAVSINGTATVNVTKKPAASNTNTNKPSNSNTNKPSNSNTNKPSNSNTNSNTNNNLSKNNNLKELSIDGYDLVKIDNNNYTLNVSKEVSNVTVNAIAEDAKSKVTGNGSHDLNIGENNIIVTVTSESGSQNKVTIKVTRKDDYYLEDLENLLNDSNTQEITITISDNAKIPTSTISKIKDKKKKVVFNYYDEDKKLVYSWILDGSTIEDIKNDISTKVSSESSEEIAALSNYADGMNINLSQNMKFPKNAMIRIPVNEKYKNGSVLNLYSHSDKSLKLIRNDLTVKNGYVEFYVEDATEYFITKSNIGVKEDTVTSEDNSTDIFLIIAIIELIIIIILTVLYFKKGEKSGNKSTIIEEKVGIEKEIGLNPIENDNKKEELGNAENKSLEDIESIESFNDLD